MPEIDPKFLPFTEAIAYFRKKLNIPTETWQDIWQEEHDIAFVVAGATKADLLDDLRQAVEKAIAEGTTRDEFRKDFDQIVEKHGWSYKGDRNWRTDVIYGTNLRVAYAAGRYEQMTEPSVVQARPYWMWMHGDSPHPRPLHKALDGKVFPANSEFWNTMYPPSGWGCRCQAVSLSQRDVDRRGGVVEHPPKVGELLETTDKDGLKSIVKVDADPGWGYVPGKSRQEQYQGMISEITQRLPKDLRTQFQSEIQKNGNAEDQR